MTRPLRIAIVAGEESGDLLGADLVTAIGALSGQAPALVGLGGRHLASLGLESPFDSREVALMGIASVVRDLPRLLRRIRQTADLIVDAKPDILVTIDSPDFSLRVAQKVRRAAPAMPIVHYVCPSVWAWRPGRAAAMRPHVDRILCLLPFEPQELVRLGGPPGTFVGHRLSRDPQVVAARERQARRNGPDALRPRLLLLPGSRRSEVEGLLGLFRDTIETLDALGLQPELILPTVPQVEPIVTRAVKDWANPPRIVVGADEKWRAFGDADAALAASGTVTLELALAGVPLVSCYRLDLISRMLGPYVFKSWSASLPNLIAGHLVVPEIYPPMLRGDIVARYVQPLLGPTLIRQAQIEGFDAVRNRLDAGRPAGEIGAEAVLDVLEARPA